MFEKIAKFSVRFRWLIIVFWIAAIPLATANFPKISDVEKNSVSDFLPKNSQTNQASELASVFQQKNTATSTFLVYSHGGAVLTADDNLAIEAIKAKVSKVAEVTEIRDLGPSADGEAHELLVGISGAGFGQQVLAIVSNIRTAVAGVSLPSGAQANLAGELAAQVDQESSNTKGQNSTEKYTILLIIVLLLVVFRAVLAPIVTLLPAGLALMLAQPVIAESTKIGVQVGFITQILLIVLLLGAGTDYGLFLVFRMREEMRKGLTPKEAVIKALTRVGESITFSAATVIAALLALMLASFGMYKGLGPALAIGLIIMLLMALTFLPALLSILGRAVFWPSKTNKQEAVVGLWGRLADKAIEKPKSIIVLGVIVFTGLTLGMIGYKSAGFGNQSAPAGSDSAAGQKVLAEHYPAANNNPELVIFKFSDSVWSNLEVAQQAQNELTGSSIFSAISGPFNVNGNSYTTDQLQAIKASGNTEALQAIGQFVSQDGKTIQFYAVLKAGASGSTEALRATPAVVAEVQKIAKNVGAVQNGVIGSDTVAYEINQTTNKDLAKIIPIVLLMIAALLALMLRSLVAPWYLIATVGLSYLASLGFSMYVFVHLFNQDGINFVLPFLMFIFGLALGEDYNILVMSRIREETHKKSLGAAITKAIGITGTTVTSAGLILAGTFAILGLVGGNSQTQQIGFGVAFAIMLDTFFVRTLLVPSIVALLGKWNWWPSKLSARDSK